MPSHPEPRIQCLCGRCRCNPHGFTYQTRQVVAKHHKKWPAIESRTLRGTGQDRESNEWSQEEQESISRAGSPDHLPNPIPGPPPAYDLELERDEHRDGDFDRDPPNDDLDDFPPQFDRSDGYQRPGNQHDQNGPMIPSHWHGRPGPVRPPLDHNFRPVEPPRIRAPGSDQAQEDRPSLVPKGFQEKPEIRLAYLDSVISNVFGKASVKDVTASLNSTLDCLFIQKGSLPEIPRPIRHLISAKRRLGIDPDQWITQYTICPVCWKHHFTPTELQELSSPDCPIEDCTGILFKEDTDSKGRCVRESFKIMPHTSLISSLQCMFMRPGFTRLIRESQRHFGPFRVAQSCLRVSLRTGRRWRWEQGCS
ncbi:hypothetical protein V8E55_009490 [Tylopilus felleus]